MDEEVSWRGDEGFIWAERGHAGVTGVLGREMSERVGGLLFIWDL